MPGTPPHITIIGLGKIGTAVAQVLVDRGVEVTGIRRSAGASDLNVVSADAADPNSLAAAVPEYSDVVLVILTPSGRDEASYRQAYVQTAQTITEVFSAQAEKPKRIIFVSSTSVYHQQQDEWVDEQSETLSSSPTAQQLLAAEAIYRDCSIDTTVVRFAGIYGPGRYRLIQQAERGELPAPSPALYTNRIREEDCTGFLVHLVERAIAGELIEPVYIGCDSSPVPLYDLLIWMRDSLKSEPGGLTEVAPSRLRQSKRCSNQQMLSSGYQLKYPDYKAGYGDLISQYLNQQS